MYVNGSMQRPLQGISQQPADVRNEGQCTWQENMQPNVVEGLSKRIGTNFIARINRDIVDNSKTHFYNRGDDERYFINVHSDGISVWDDRGTPYPVEMNPKSWEYVNSSDIKKDVNLQTISDFTFISNGTKAPYWDEQVERPVTNTALIPVLFADYGKTYSIIANGETVASYKTPDGSHPDHINYVETTYVADQLLTSIGKSVSQNTPSIRRIRRWNSTAGAGGDHERNYKHYEEKVMIPAGVPADSIWNTRHGAPQKVNGDWLEIRYSKSVGSWDKDHIGVFEDPSYVSHYVGGETWNARRNTNVIYLSRTDGAAFTLATTDGRDGADMPAILHATEEIKNLPKYAPVGYPVKITGRGKQSNAQYWLRAERANAETESIVWMEARAPEARFKLDQYTMPQALVRDFKEDGSRYFKLEPVDWDERKVGDDISNPAPSFIEDGQPITNIGIFQNRLFFLAGESFVASTSNEFFNFFKKTTQTEEEDRPIDKYADTEEVNYLRNYAALDGDLVLFASGAQFVIKGDKAITADNMNMRLVTQYKNNAHIKPATTGETTLFSYNVGQNVQVREFYTDSYTDTKKARPITEHVDSLIKGNVLQMIGSTNVNTIIVRTDTDLSKMYMYDYLWQGADKVQSAWWVYSVRPQDKIRYVVYDRSDMFILVLRDGIGLCLEYVNVGDPEDSGMGLNLRLDSKHKVTLVRSPNKGTEWTVQIPQTFPDASYHEVIIGAGGYAEEIGNTVEVTRKGDRHVVEPADLAPDGVNQIEGYVGIPYTATFIPTNPIIKDEKNNEYGLDRLTVNTMYVNYSLTGAFSASVKTKWGQVRDYHYSGRVMGRVGNIVGFAKIDSGQFPIPIRDKNDNLQITLWSESYLPFVVRNLEWKGMINLRGRRV